MGKTVKENPIDKLHGYMKNTGYNGSVSDLQNLLNTNEEARNSIYAELKKTGFNGDMNQFNSTFGVVVGGDTTAKKKDNSGLGSDGSTSVSGNTTSAVSTPQKSTDSFEALLQEVDSKPSSDIPSINERIKVDSAPDIMEQKLETEKQKLANQDINPDSLISLQRTQTKAFQNAFGENRTPSEVSPEEILQGYQAKDVFIDDRGATKNQKEVGQQINEKNKRIGKLNVYSKSLNAEMERLKYNNRDAINDYTQIISTLDSTQDEIESLRDNINSKLAKLQEDGYIKKTEEGFIELKPSEQFDEIRELQEQAKAKVQVLEDNLAEHDLLIKNPAIQQYNNIQKRRQEVQDVSERLNENLSAVQKLDEVFKNKQIDVDTAEGKNFIQSVGRFLNRTVASSTDDAAAGVIRTIDSVDGVEDQNVLDDIWNILTYRSTHLKGYNPTQSRYQTGFVENTVDVNGARVYLDENQDIKFIRNSKGNDTISDEEKKAIANEYESNKSSYIDNVKRRKNYKGAFVQGLDVIGEMAPQLILTRKFTGSARAWGVGTKTANSIGIATSVYPTVYKDYYDEAVRAGVIKPGKYASIQSTTISLSSILNPAEAKVFQGINKEAVKMSAQQLRYLNPSAKKFAQTVWNNTKTLSKEAGKEFFEEAFVEKIAEISVNRLYNEMQGVDLDDSMSLEEMEHTAYVTLLPSLFFGVSQLSSTKGYERATIEYAIDNPEEVSRQLDLAVRAGNMSNMDAMRVRNNIRNAIAIDRNLSAEDRDVRIEAIFGEINKRKQEKYGKAYEDANKAPGTTPEKQERSTGEGRVDEIAVFDPIESEAEAVEKMMKPLEDFEGEEREIRAREIAKQHTLSYYDYVETQENSDAIKQSDNYKNFEQATFEILMGEKDYNNNPEQSFENGSRIDEQGNQISEYEYQLQKGNVVDSAGDKNREDIIGEFVNYQGIEGILSNINGDYYVVTPEQDIFVEGGASESTNSDLGIIRIKRPTISEQDIEKIEQDEDAYIDQRSVTSDWEKNTFRIGENEYKYISVNTDNNGNVVSIQAETADGEKRTIRSKEVVAQIENQKIEFENYETLKTITDEEFDTAIKETGVKPIEEKTKQVQPTRPKQNTQTVVEKQTAINEQVQDSGEVLEVSPETEVKPQAEQEQETVQAEEVELEEDFDLPPRFQELPIKRQNELIAEYKSDNVTNIEYNVIERLIAIGSSVGSRPFNKEDLAKELGFTRSRMGQSETKMTSEITDYKHLYSVKGGKTLQDVGDDMATDINSELGYDATNGFEVSQIIRRLLGSTGGKTENLTSEIRSIVEKRHDFDIDEEYHRKRQQRELDKLELEERQIADRVFKEQMDSLSEEEIIKSYNEIINQQANEELQQRPIRKNESSSSKRESVRSSPEEKSRQQELKSAEQEVTAAQKAYDQKKKELGANLQGNQESMFDDGANDGLFGRQIADETQAQKALEPYKARLDKAKANLKKLQDTELNEGTGEIDFDSKNRIDEINKKIEEENSKEYKETDRIIETKDGPINAKELNEKKRSDRIEKLEEEKKQLSGESKPVDKIKEFQNRLSSNDKKTESTKQKEIKERIVDSMRGDEQIAKSSIFPIREVSRGVYSGWVVANKIISKYTTDAIAKAFTDQVLKAGRSKYWLPRQTYRTVNSFFSFAVRNKEATQKLYDKIGGEKVAIHDARIVDEQLRELVKDDNQLLIVHSLLDPEMYEDGMVDYGQGNLSITNPKTGKVIHFNINNLDENTVILYETIRFINDEIHEANYKNGFISEETYKKFKPDQTKPAIYIARQYEWTSNPEEDFKQEVKNSRLYLEYTKMRKELTDMMKENAIQDPIALTVLRMAQTDRNIAIKKYLDWVAKDKNLSSKTKVKGWKKLPNIKTFGSLKGSWVAPHIYDDIVGYSFSHPLVDTLYRAMLWLDRTDVVQFLKKKNTVFNPATTLGNISGNQVFAMWAGIPQIDFQKEYAKEIIFGVVNKSQTTQFKNPGRYRDALRFGLIDNNYVKEELDHEQKTMLIEWIKEHAKKFKLGNITLDTYENIDNFASEFYGNADNAAKIAAYSSLLNYEMNQFKTVNQRYPNAQEEEVMKRKAADKVLDGFQNYATVGKIYEFASKTPLFGNRYVKFSGDLVRIMANSFKNNPLSIPSFIFMLNAFSQITSELSGEDDEERKARLSRQFIPKFEVPLLGDVAPLMFRFGNTEVNLARYLSPYYIYDRATGNSMAMMNRFMPYGVDIKSGAKNQNLLPTVTPQDVLLAPLVQVWQDMDYRGKSITDPKGNYFKTTSPSKSIRWARRIDYLSKSYIPYYGYATDVVKVAKYGEDSFERKKTVAQQLGTLFLRMQEVDEDIIYEKLKKEVGWLEQQAIYSEQAVKNVHKNFIKEVIEIQEDDNISEGQRSKKLKALQKEYDKNIDESYRLFIKALQLRNQRFEDVIVDKNYEPVDGFDKIKKGLTKEEFIKEYSKVHNKWREDRGLKTIEFID